MRCYRIETTVGPEPKLISGGAADSHGRTSMTHPAYTIMERPYYYAGTLGVRRGWRPVSWCPCDDDAPPITSRYSADAGHEILVADGPAEARALIEYCDAIPRHLGHGESGGPDTGYVQPSGKVRRIS